MAALPAAIAAGMPHAVVPIVVSIVVTGLVGIIGKYLLYYARNRRARSIAEIRRAALDGKIAVEEAEKLIRADIEADADARPLEGDRKDTSPPAVAGRLTLMLRRLRLL